MSKSVSFHKPSKPVSPDVWVTTKVPLVVADEPTKRFTVDVPEALHKRVKVACAIEGVTIADKVRELLGQHFPVSS